MTPPEQTLTVRGHLRIFGYEDTELELTVIPRSTRWRALRAGPWFAAAAVAAVLVILPPHVLWILLALVAVGLGIRKWTERHTLVELLGSCPRCGAEIAEAGPGRFRPGATVDCPSCQHGSRVVLPEGALTAWGLFTHRS